MTFLIERLVELRRHLDHLYALRPRVGSAADLGRAVDALARLDPVERFLEVSAAIESGATPDGRRP